MLLDAPSAGAYTIDKPLPNCVSLTLTDNNGHTHVITGSFQGGLYTTCTFNGVQGSSVELMASQAGDSWVPSSQSGVTFA